MSRLKMRFRPGKSYLARVYPEIVDTAVDSTAPPPAYRTVLSSQSQKTPSR